VVILRLDFRTVLNFFRIVKLGASSTKVFFAVVVAEVFTLQLV